MWMGNFDPKVQRGHGQKKLIGSYKACWSRKHAFFLFEFYKGREGTCNCLNFGSFVLFYATFFPCQESGSYLPKIPYAF